MSLSDEFTFGRNQDEPSTSEKSALFEYFNESSPVRVIYFIQPSGIQYSFYYADLLQGVYMPDDSYISLYFRSVKVVLAGFNLKELFEKLMSQQVKSVRCLEKRYVENYTSTKAAVTSIELI